MPKSKSLLATVGKISSATGLSRILGLVRDQLQSYFFGAGMVTDAYVTAFRIPNLLRDLFAEGALSSAFVPTFTAEREHRGAESAWRLANRLIVALGVVLGALTLIIAFGAPWIIRLYAPGFEDPAKLELAVTMTRILAPFLLFIALAAVAMGVLNTCGRFFLPSLAPASFNVAAILGMILLVPMLPRFGLHPGLALAIGAIVGGALQFLVQVPAMRAEGFRFRPSFSFRDPGLRRIGTLMVPATIGLAATQLNILVDNILASTFGDGPITYLQLAFRLMQLPIGLFGVAIATANLARVSQNAPHGDLDGLRANLASTLGAAGLPTLPAAVGLIALREPIVQVLFEHGRFDAEDTARTAATVLCYALGLFAYAVTKIQVPTFYALGDTRTPVKASVGAVLSKIGANFVFIWLLRRLGFDPFLGLAISTAMASWLNFGWLALGLRRRVGSMREHAVVGTCLRMLVLSATMGVACAWFHATLLGAWSGGGLAGEIVRLGAAIAVGVAIVATGLWWFDFPEVRTLTKRFGKR
jgi:putative peptidoglycan lipid II flippase